MATEEPGFGFATFTVAPNPTRTWRNQSENCIARRFIQHDDMHIYLKQGKTCADSAAENTNFVKRSSRVNLSNTSSMDNSVLAECGSSHKMVYWLSVLRESGLAVTDHNTPVCVDPEEVTHVAFFRLTVWALSTLACEYRKSMISGFQMSHSLPYALHNPIHRPHICIYILVVHLKEFRTNG